VPIILEIAPAPGIRAGVWRIDEPVEMLAMIAGPYGPSGDPAAMIRSESRKRQRLACRALLKTMMSPLQAEVCAEASGKPFLLSASHRISFSHTDELAAVAVSETLPVGIDIERVQERLTRVKDRFLQEDELLMITPENGIEMLTLLWCAKEAVYKLHGTTDVDLRGDIHIHPIDYLCSMNIAGAAILNGPDGRRGCNLRFERIGDHRMAVAWAEKA
jgi:4'-phosphopantetheinyl transferase